MDSLTSMTVSNMRTILNKTSTMDAVTDPTVPLADYEGSDSTGVQPVVTSMTVSKLRMIPINDDFDQDVSSVSSDLGQSGVDSLTSMTVSKLRTIGISDSDSVLDDVIADITVSDRVQSVVNTMTVSDLRTVLNSDVDAVLPYSELLSLLGTTESSTVVGDGQVTRFDFRSKREIERAAREESRRVERIEREAKRRERAEHPREAERVYEVVTGPNYRSVRSFIPKAPSKGSCASESVLLPAGPMVSAEEFKQALVTVVDTVTEDDFLGDLVDDFDGGDEDRDGQTIGFSYRQYRSLTKCMVTRKFEFVRPGLVTLLYRNIVDAPTYAVAKSHMKMFAVMHRSAWRVELNGVWKFETAKDGETPHAHEYMELPVGLSRHPTKAEHNSAKWEMFNGLEYDVWVEAVWQFITNQVPNERMPRLTHVSRRGEGSLLWAQIYFGKRSAALKRKRYQNRCPKAWIAPGRVMQLWGRHGLKELNVEVTKASAESYQRVKRASRKLSSRTVEAVDTKTGEVTEKKVKRFVHGGVRGGFDIGEFSEASQSALRRIAAGK